MSIFGSVFKSLLKQDPSMREIIKMKEALDEHNKNAANWTSEERQWAEEATAWLRANESKASE